MPGWTQYLQNVAECVECRCITFYVLYQQQLDRIHEIWPLVSDFVRLPSNTYTKKAKRLIISMYVQC